MSSKDTNNGIPPDTIIGSKYRIVKRIGSGSFGEIYSGTHVYQQEQSQQVAIKFEKKSARCPQLRHEFKVYRELQGCSGIGRVLYYGSFRDFNVMVMELLGPSLEDLFNKCGRKFSLRTTLMLADQLLERVEILHENHLIHRDIKPANFVIGIGETADMVFGIDFGLSKRYRHPHTLQHIPYKEGRSLTGTPRYASIANHRGIETSRRDDLESIGYILVYFLLGKLPWQGLKLPANVQGTASQKHQLILDKKQLTSLSDLCRGLPREFQEYLQYCRDLQFDAKPDINYLRGVFRQLYAAQGYSDDAPWDWDPSGTVKERRPSTAESVQQKKSTDALQRPAHVRTISNAATMGGAVSSTGLVSSSDQPPQKNPNENATEANAATPHGLSKTHGTYQSNAAQARPWTANTDAAASMPGGMSHVGNATTDGRPGTSNGLQAQWPRTDAAEDGFVKHRPITSRDQVIISYANDAGRGSHHATDARRSAGHAAQQKQPRAAAYQAEDTGFTDQPNPSMRPNSAPGRQPTASRKHHAGAWRFLDEDRNHLGGGAAGGGGGNTANAGANAGQSWGDVGATGNGGARRYGADADADVYGGGGYEGDGYGGAYRYSGAAHFGGAPLSLVRHRRSVSRSGDRHARPLSGNPSSGGYGNTRYGSNGLKGNGYNLGRHGNSFWGSQQHQVRLEKAL